MIPPPAWLDPARPYLVGISGGRDSVALHHWLRNHGFQNLIYCHLNHRLRGQESDDDEAFLRDLLGSSLRCAKTDVTTLASEQKLSLETAAREARHRFFETCADKTGTHEILLAHHADDQAETILFNLLRGSAGARGMKASQKIGTLTFLRPLLKVRRADIDFFLTQHGHRFREDSSNCEPVASRNRLRNEAIPLLKEILGRDITPGLLRAHDHRRELEAFANSQIDLINHLDPQGRIHLPSFRTLPTVLQKMALHHYLRDRGTPGLTSELIHQGLLLTDPSHSPSLNLPGGLRLRRKESRLFISP